MIVDCVLCQTSRNIDLDLKTGYRRSVFSVCVERPIIGRTHNARENLAFNVRTHNNWQANTLVTAIFFFFFFLPFLVAKEQGEVTQHPMGETGNKW